MTRDEFADMINGLVAQGKITLLEAAKLRHSFDVGDIAQVSIPLPWRKLPGKLTKEEFHSALRSAAAFITPKDGGQRLLNSEKKPRITETPPEVKRILRERLRNHFRGDYEGTMRRYASGLSKGGNVQGWHGAMIREQRAYIARQMTAGLGRALTQKEMDEVNRLSAQQNHYLQRFAGEVSARKVLGRDFSQAYLANRSLQYGGVGWGAWFKGNEIVEGKGDGKLIRYEAIDDPNTCGPCHEAQANGPYLPGSEGIPYPGEVCRGHGLCRCRHVIYFDMVEWRKLKGLPEDDTERRAKEAQAKLDEEVAQERKREEEKAAKRLKKLKAEAKKLGLDDSLEPEAIEQSIKVKKEQNKEEIKQLKADAKRFYLDPKTPIDELRELVRVEKERQARFDEMLRLQVEKEVEESKREAQQREQDKIDRYNDDIEKTLAKGATLDFSRGQAVRKELEPKLIKQVQERLDLYFKMNELMAHIDADDRDREKRVAEAPEEDKEKVSQQGWMQRLDNRILLEQLSSDYYGFGDKMREVVRQELELPESQRSKIQANISPHWQEDVDNGRESQRDVDSLLNLAEEAKLVLQSVLANTDFELEIDVSAGRASASGHTISVETADDIYTLIHEMIHVVETVKGADYRAKRVAFYEQRTKGDPLENMRDLQPTANYGKQEITKKDKWMNPYVGRLYYPDSDDDPRSEVVTMGVQWLFEDPIRLIQEDPELFDFIVGYLGGTL